MRPTATGLATAFFRLYLLDTLSHAPARPASILAHVAAEKLPFATGAFGRALQSLLEGGHLVPARDGMVALTALGAAERVAERERWSAVMPSVMRLLGDVAPRPAPDIAEAPPAHRAKIAHAYAERVLVAIGIEHANEATRRAMVHRAIRASLGGATTLFGGDVTAFRYGDEGISLIADRADHSGLATLARARIDELVRSMTSSVRAFGGARWHVHAGGATWSMELGTTGALLRAAEDALRADGEASSAA